MAPIERVFRGLPQGQVAAPDAARQPLIHGEHPGQTLTLQARRAGEIARGDEARDLAGSEQQILHRRASAAEAPQRTGGKRPAEAAGERQANLGISH